MNTSKHKTSRQAHQSGDAWTAYSDLFTTLSVIFLMMFVFTLVRLTINSVQSNKEKKQASAILEGKIPEEIKKQTDDKKAEIAKSIDQIQVYRNTIQNRVLEMNQLVAGLEKHQKIADQLLEEQRRTEGNVAQMKSLLADRFKQVMKAQNQAAKLSKKLEETDLLLKAKNQEALNFAAVLSSRETQYVNAQQLEKKLKAELQKKDDDLAALTSTALAHESRLAQQNSEIEKLKSVLASKEGDVQSSQNELNALRSQVAGLGRSLEDKDKKIGELQTGLNGFKSALASKDGELGAARGEIAGLRGKLAGVGRGLADKDRLIGELETGLAGLKGALAAKEGELGTARGELAGLRGKLGDGGTGKEKAYTQEIEKLKHQLLVAQSVTGREPAATQSTSAEMRMRVAGKIAGRINGMDPSIKADAKTGNITMFFDEAFLFGNDQATIAKTTEEKLKKIIPIYTDELFGDKETRAHLNHVNIIGHASPRYGGKYVKVSDNNAEAYYHNLELSSHRAINIVKFIFSPDLGSFKYKNELKAKIHAQGASFSNPVPLDRSIASSQQDSEFGKCGEYDCKRSRRVEISFELKGDGGR